MSFNAAHLGCSHSVKAPVQRNRPVERYKDGGHEQAPGCEAHGQPLPGVEVQNEDAAGSGRYMDV